jgi:large subunit ribosomal protein L1
MKKSKRYKQAQEQVEEKRVYSVQEAIPVLKKFPKAKFDESLEVSIKLGVDPKKSDQMVRGSVKLPYGTGKTKRVIVFCEPEKEETARAAGADFAGGQDLVDKVSKGWLDFDYCVSTPSMMKNVSRLGRTLGPRGLMPSPKAGSVTDDIASIVKDAKAGKLDFKMDKFGSLNVAIGKMSFSENELVDNCNYFLTSLIQVRPKAAKGKFIKELSLSTTMGPGVRLQLPKEV